MSLEVLFVCTANICRSPFMELYARSAAGEASGLRFASAGTHGFTDEPMNPPMAEELSLRGVDASAFRSRPLSRDLLDAADLVLTAERWHRTFLLEEHPTVFRRTFTLAHAAELLAAHPGEDPIGAISGRGGAAGAEHDVADPYARGAEAAAACATTLVSLLDPVVAALGTADAAPTHEPDPGRTEET